MIYVCPWAYKVPGPSRRKWETTRRGVTCRVHAKRKRKREKSPGLQDGEGEGEANESKEEERGMLEKTKTFYNRPRKRNEENCECDGATGTVWIVRDTKS
ncbi:hypothetical protein A0H81_09289 [Grifola frondosa]|uniref:Uncharacterized protein n=1 Tax=Grifola frondosa TaxID=5627 RepID=A0A1C7M338_GRIFR|nr:hypothetical protein A0H81_09289 [Grifola frondosa]